VIAEVSRRKKTAANSQSFKK